MSPAPNKLTSLSLSERARLKISSFSYKRSKDFQRAYLSFWPLGSFKVRFQMNSDTVCEMLQTCAAGVWVLGLGLNLCWKICFSILVSREWKHIICPFSSRFLGKAWQQDWGSSVWHRTERAECAFCLQTTVNLGWIWRSRAGGTLGQYCLRASALPSVIRSGSLPGGNDLGAFS